MGAALAPRAAQATHAASGTAARVQLTVKILDRNGQRTAPLDLQLLKLASNTNIDMGTSTSRLVFPGRYNVAAWIPTGTSPNQSYTLADRIIDLTSSRTITFDARQGKLARFRLDSSTAQEETLEIAPVFGSSEWAFNPTTIVGTPVHDTYVIPASVKGMTLYAYSVWEKTGNTIANPSPFRYDLIHVSRGGIPASPVFTVAQSSLARVDVTVRATDSGQQATLELSPMANQSVPLNCGTTLGATPAKLVSYRTPGYRWQPIVDLTSPSGEIRMNDLSLPSYSRGHFRESYADAVLAPGQYDVFADVEGRRLQIGQSQFPLQDPLHPTDLGSGLTQRARLYSGSTLIGSSSGGKNINVNIPWATHQYSYHVDVTRKASATLSTRISGIWRFAAHRVPISQGGLTPPIWEVQLLPGQLDLRNRAAAGATTSVRLSIFGVSDVTPVRLPVVRAYASADDGSTWSAVAPHSVGDHYVFAVHDPGQAGFVSLRVYVRAADGSSEQLTVNHAYGVR